MTPHPRRFHPPGRTQRPNRRCPSLPRDGGRHIPSLPVSASLPGSLRIPAKPLRDSAGTGLPPPAPQSPHGKTATGKSPFHAATLAVNLARLRCAPFFHACGLIRTAGPFPRHVSLLACPQNAPHAPRRRGTAEAYGHPRHGTPVSPGGTQRLPPVPSTVRTCRCAGSERFPGKGEKAGTLKRKEASCDVR